MQPEHLRYLACPSCHGDLRLEIRERSEGRIKSGDLHCMACTQTYEIRGFVPRFVPQDNYASNFGLEWTKHARTQYDSDSGSNVSEKRFFEETRWEHALPGELILEAGSGSGRFTEQAVSTGAMVISFDYSYAVEANYASNGHHPNLLIVQADIYRMPFRPESFPKVFCFGVLQHTPDPERSLRSLVQVVSPGGNLVVDVYKRRARFKHMLVTKYWVRPLTRKMDPARLYRLTPRHVRLMWPLAKWIHRLPYGRIINWQLLIADYRGTYDLREETLKEWAVLDTFDMLSPRYDFPQTIETVTRWCKDAGLGAIEVAFGYNGIEGRGIKPTA